MRGNHRLWGRDDYTEPLPMSPEDIDKVNAVNVAPKGDGYKTWFSVFKENKLIGYVTTRCGGQAFRTPNMDSWTWAASTWNNSDPKHGRAILALLREVDT